MNANWQEYSINELKAASKNSIAMGPFGSRIKAENFVTQGVPVIKGGNLNGAFILEDHFDYLSEQKALELISSNAFRGDIVITHRGTIGQVGIIPSNSKYTRYVVSQSQLKITLDQKKINPYFLYYFLRSPIGQHRLLANASQVGVPAIAQASTSVKSIQVPCPEKKIQNEIVKILLDLDFKIELNRKINKSLEQIAQAIFKSWFVDFDPTRAKITAKEEWENSSGSKTKSKQAKASFIERAAIHAISGKSDSELDNLDKEELEKLNTIATMFPDTLVKSELGDVPMGWEIRRLSSMIHLIGGGTPNRSEATYWDGHIPWFSIKDVPNSSDVFVVSTEEKITTLGLEKSSTKLLPVGATIISARGTVGKLALVATPMCINQSCYGTIGVEGIGNFFNYFNLSEAISTLQRNTHGAVFDTITTKSFDSYSMAFCGNQLANKFDSMVEPLLMKIESNVRENIFLSDLRDSLLPKLLAGELSVGEVA